MLSLTRKPGEMVCIGEKGEITVRVSKINGNQVVLSFDAPDDVPIHREEIFKRMGDNAKSFAKDK